MVQRNVRVEAIFSPEFNYDVRPTAFYLEVKGALRRFTIDKVVEETKAASQRLGRFGIRYTCRVRERYVYLYKDIDEWHMESVE